MTGERVRIKTTLPIHEVEKLKAWALERGTTVTAMIRQLIRYGEFIEGIEKNPDRRLLVEEPDGRMFEIRWVDPVDDPKPRLLNQPGDQDLAPVRPRGDEHEQK